VKFAFELHLTCGVVNAAQEFGKLETEIDVMRLFYGVMNDAPEYLKLATELI